MALPFGLAATLGVSRMLRPRALLAVLVLGVAAAFAIGSERDQPLTLFGENRPHYWRVAWQDAEEHPVLGSGAGTFGAYWLEHRPIDEFVHDAHSLFLETLAELGPPGLALVVLGLGVPVLALGRRRERLVAAAAGAYVAFLLHAAIDWDWEFGAVGLLAIGCGGATLVGTRPADASPLGPVARGALLVAVLGVATVDLARLPG
jgi:O-antigen ligase